MPLHMVRNDITTMKVYAIGDFLLHHDMTVYLVIFDSICRAFRDVRSSKPLAEHWKDTIEDVGPLLNVGD